MHSVDIPPPIGCHYYFNKVSDQWEVSLFAANTETIGGERDGCVSYSRFGLDLKELMTAFDEIATCSWQALSLGSDDEVGPHVSLEGTFEGHNVWLRVLAQPPARFRTGRYLKAYELRFEDAW